MRKILLIEDDVIIRESTAELLEFTDKYDVITAENGKIGIEKALKELPDLILCDIMMPEVDGFGVLEKLSQNTSTQFIPFIFLSAKTERANIRKGMNLGADDYITKPFTEEELYNAIESRLNKSDLLEELRLTQKETTNKNELKNLSDLKAYFEQHGDDFFYKLDEKIYEEENNSNYVFLIIKGKVKCYKLNDHGKILTTSIYKEGDLFGYTSFLNNEPYEETSVTIEPVKLVGLKKTTLVNLLKDNNKVVLDLVELLTDNLNDVKEQLLDMAYNSVLKKTADTLLKFTEKTDTIINVPRQDLANIAGISTETLIRSISKLKKQGIIDVNGRNIKIIDLEALKTIE